MKLNPLACKLDLDNANKINAYIVSLMLKKQLLKSSVASGNVRASKLVAGLLISTVPSMFLSEKENKSSLIPYHLRIFVCHPLLPRLNFQHLPLHGLLACLHIPRTCLDCGHDIVTVCINQPPLPF